MNTKSRNQGFVLGGLLILFGVLALLENVTDFSIWIWVGVLVIGSLLVYAVYATDREEKWMLIISYAMLAVAGLLTLLELDVLKDALVATYVLLAIALPFLMAFLLNRTNWGLLIPAYVLFVIGVMIPLIEIGVLADFIIPAYILFAIAIPFFAVYLRNSSNWWALIPAGILSVIAASFLVAEAAVEYIIAVALIGGGILIVVRQFTRRDEIDDAGSPPEELAE